MITVFDSELTDWKQVRVEVFEAANYGEVWVSLENYLIAGQPFPLPRSSTEVTPFTSDFISDLGIYNKTEHRIGIPNYLRRKRAGLKSASEILYFHSANKLSSIL